MSTYVDLFETILATAAFQSVTFPVSRISNQGGHDGVEHTAYARRGADNEPTGQQPYSGTLTIPFVNDLAGWDGTTLFPDQHDLFISTLEANPIGTLQHPTKGTFQAFVKAWPEEYEPDVRNGVTVTLHWTEQNGAASTTFDSSGSPQQNTPQGATNAAAAADAAMANVAASGWTATTGAVVSGLSVLEAGQVDPSTGNASPLPSGQILGTITTMLGPVQQNLASNLFAGAAAHTATAALEALQAIIYQLRDRYIAGFASASIYVTTADMPLWQVAMVMYGDAGKVAKVLSANQVSDPLFIPMGTQLVMLP